MGATRAVAAAALVILALLVTSTVAGAVGPTTSSTNAVTSSTVSTSSTTANHVIGNATVPQVSFHYTATKFSFADSVANLTLLLPKLTLRVVGATALSCSVSFSAPTFSHNSTTYIWQFVAPSAVLCNGASVSPVMNVYLLNSSTSLHQKEIIVKGTNTKLLGVTLSVASIVSFPLTYTGNAVVSGSTLTLGNIGMDWTALGAFSPTFLLATKTLTVTTTGTTLGTVSYVLDPTTIGTSNSNGNCGGTGCDNQLRLWQANGYYWNFYTDNSHFGYRSCLITSGNCGTSSANWSGFTNINTNAGIADCSTYVNSTIDSTYLYYACGTASNSFTFNAGHLTSGGTFIPSRAQITVTTTNSQSGYAFVLAVTNASVWVAVKTYDGTNEHIEVWSANFQGVGAFSKQLDQNDNFGNNDAHPSLDAVRTGGTTYIELTWGYDGYGINFPLKIRWTTNYGSTWASPVATSCNIDAMGYSQVANSNGTEYIVATQAGGSGCTQGKLDYIRWDYGSASITYETKNFLTTCSNNCDANTISTDGGPNYAIAYESSTSSIAYRLSSDSGDTYGSAITLSSAETLGSIDFTLSASYFCTGSQVLLGWMSGSGTPFDVRFATFACSAGAFTQTLSATVNFTPSVNFGPGLTLSQTVSLNASIPTQQIGVTLADTVNFLAAIAVGPESLLSAVINFAPNVMGCQGNPCFFTTTTSTSTTTTTTTTTITSGSGNSTQLIGGNEISGFDSVLIGLAFIVGVFIAAVATKAKSSPLGMAESFTNRGKDRKTQA